MGHDIKKVDTYLPKEVFNNYEVIEVSDFNDLFDFKALVKDAMGLFDANNIIQNIEKNSEYIVQIPAELKEKYESGEYFIMKNKANGTEWPTLMKVNDSGRNEIVTPLSIKKEDILQGNPIHDLTMQYQMMQIQNQMQEQMEMLKEIYEVVKNIEKGQMNDRIALLEAGKEQIDYALSINDAKLKKDTIQSGLNNLIVAKDQIFEELKNRIINFNKIPANKALQVVNGIIKSDYLASQDNEYNKICEYFDFYKQSIQAIAYAYMLLGEQQMVEKVYEKAINNFKSISFKNIKTIAYIHENEDVDILNESKVELLEEDKKTCESYCKQYQGIAIKLNSNLLMEAIGYENKQEFKG